MNEPSYGETGSRTGGYVLIGLVIALGLFCVIGIGVIKPLSDNAAAQEQARAFAVAQQSQAQIAAERERTERVTQEQQSARESARNRAEIVTAGLVIVGATLAFGLVLAGGVGLVYGLEKVLGAAAEQRHQRVLIYTAQMQQLALAQAASGLALPGPARDERAGVLVIGRGGEANV